MNNTLIGLFTSKFTAKSSLILQLKYTFIIVSDITAALSVVTAGLLKNIFSLDYSYVSISVCLLATIAAVLISGKYRLLERIATFFVVLFTVFTFASVFMIAPDFVWQSAQYIPELSFDTTQVLFLIALIGWMPTAVGISIFQSLWVNAKSKELGRRVTMAEARFDFNFGYFLTSILAICFLFLGAALLYNSGTEMPSSAAGFASMLITMFASAIGDWVIPLISAAAIAVMTSSLMTVLDGYPRAFQAMQKIISPNSAEDNRYYYATIGTNFRCDITDYIFIKVFQNLYRSSH